MHHEIFAPVRIAVVVCLLLTGLQCAVRDNPLDTASPYRAAFQPREIDSVDVVPDTVSVGPEFEFRVTVYFTDRDSAISSIKQSFSSAGTYFLFVRLVDDSRDSAQTVQVPIVVIGG